MHHDDYMVNKNADGLRGLAMIFGMYIVEVIEANFGKGRLEANHPDFGAGCFPFYWQGLVIFPVAWCEKRIFDGPGDDVWFKFNAMIASGRKDPT